MMHQTAGNGAGEYQEEEEYLVETVQVIDGEVCGLRTGPRPVAAYNDAGRALQRLRDEELERYEGVRDRPYFGRVDFFAEDTQELTPAYVGKESIGRRVLSWATPLAAQVFYVDPGGVVGYEAPGGYIPGTITLKRHYAIEKATLLDVTELYRATAGDVETSFRDASQRFLSDQLSKSRGELRETIATIRPEQYERIAAAPLQVVLVEGVAGSGKTIVGLHRIAYLLSPANERTERIRASQVIFFGPTKFFLGYVANLLPSLNVRDIRQTTIRDWLASTLSGRVRLDDGTPILEQLLRHNGDEWQAVYRAAKLKGSRLMGRIVEQYVNMRRKQFFSAATAVTLEFVSGHAKGLDLREVRDVLNSIPAGPLNMQRGRVIERLLDALWAAQQTDGVTEGRTVEHRHRFTERARSEVERQVHAFWPQLDFQEEYRALLSDSKALSLASSNRLDRQQSLELAGSLPQRTGVFRPEDLGPLCYLDQQLNNRPNAGFEHVVIDEAQEVSPLELMIVRQHSRGDSFTVLGDLAQGLSPGGIDHWSEVAQLFNGATVSRFAARSTYRATDEITKFANRILRKVHAKAPAAVPLGRHDLPPTLTSSRSYAEMLAAVASDATELQQHGMQTLAVLCKTAAEAKKLHKGLRDAGLTNIKLLGSRDDGESGVVVAPIYMVRGMEYDAVILANAGKRSYTGSSLHNTLFYLAVTRAAHRLHIHWFGPPAAILEGHHRVARRATNSANAKPPTRSRRRQLRPVA